MKEIGYNGPNPPRGKAHRYYFKVYALDKKLALKAGATKKQLLKAMKGHILAEGKLMGKFKR
jgi:Raf kinase inhibitor-like YbhB/YbcL family protein